MRSAVNSIYISCKSYYNYTCNLQIMPWIFVVQIWIIDSNSF
nr:MAG TPA: hypothetical protein [Caudoviricetes sp.]